MWQLASNSSILDAKELLKSGQICLYVSWDNYDPANLIKASLRSWCNHLRKTCGLLPEPSFATLEVCNVFDWSSLWPIRKRPRILNRLLFKNRNETIPNNSEIHERIHISSIFERGDLVRYRLIIGDHFLLLEDSVLLDELLLLPRLFLSVSPFWAPFEEATTSTTSGSAIDLFFLSPWESIGSLSRSWKKLGRMRTC